MEQLATPAPHYRGLIFDCDGTIADTMAIYYLAWNRSIKLLNGPHMMDWETFAKNGGRDFRESLACYNEQFNCQLDYRVFSEALEKVLEELIPLVEPIRPVVDLINREKRPMAVSSSGRRQVVEYTLQKLNVRSRFRAVFTSDDVKRVKPHPDLFLLAAEALNLKPKDCLVFEDSPLGKEAALRAGMDCQLIPHDWWNLNLLRTITE